MAGGFDVPNWAQNVLLEHAGLSLVAPAVRVDNDRLLCFMDLKTRIEYVIDKNTGEVKVH